MMWLASQWITTMPPRSRSVVIVRRMVFWSAIVSPR